MNYFSGSLWQGLLTLEIIVGRVILVGDTVVFAKVTKVVLRSQMLHEFIVVEISLVAELAERMPSMRSVVGISLAPMPRQLLPVVDSSLVGEQVEVLDAEIAEEEGVAARVVGFERREGIAWLLLAQMALVAHERLESTPYISVLELDSRVQFVEQ